MIEEKKDALKTPMPELAMKVTNDDFQHYFKMLDSTADKVKCPVCGSREWAVPASHEDRSKPMIITMPIPQLKGKGIWHFSLICDNCAYTLFFNVGSVVRKLQEAGRV